MQHDFLRYISKVYIVKDNIAGHTLVIDRTVRLMYVFPSPEAGAGITFGQGTVCVFCGVYQRDISVVLLHFGIQQSENALTAGQCHNDGIQLLAYL